MPTLFFSDGSPYARKARVVAFEAGLGDRLREVRVDPWASPEELTRRNPFSKIPTLETDKGEALVDSPLICEYLDWLGEGGLFPEPGPARWVALRLHAIADGILDGAVARRIEIVQREEGQRSERWVARQKAAMGRALDLLEAEADRLAEEPAIGEIAVGCALGYLDYRFPEDGWRDGRPSLAGWYEGFAARPSMQATPPEPK